jgi:hypothetical protein
MRQQLSRHTFSRREQELAIGATIRLGILDANRIETLANRAGALICCQNAFSFRANLTLQNVDDEIKQRNK